MTVLLPILVLIVGLFLYFVPKDPRVQEVGRIMIFCGLLTFLLAGGPQVVSFLGR